MVKQGAGIQKTGISNQYDLSLTDFYILIEDFQRSIFICINNMLKRLATVDMMSNDIVPSLTIQVSGYKCNGALLPYLWCYCTGDTTVML